MRGGTIHVDGKEYTAVAVLPPYPKDLIDGNGKRVLASRTERQQEAAIAASRLIHNFPDIIIAPATEEIVLAFGGDPTESPMAYLRPVARRATMSWCHEIDCAGE